MTEKLKVSREVADAIEYLGKVECDFEEVMELHVSAGWSNFSDERVTELDGLTTRELAIALINGYEVEMTPHELIQKAYKKSNVKRGVSVGLNDMILAGAENGFMNGVEFTLNTLGITVKGVNDDDNNS